MLKKCPLNIYDFSRDIQKQAMKAIYTFFIITLLVSGLCSCNTTRDNKYYPVRTTSPRISTLGFYVSPPPGDDWYEKRLKQSLYYFKNTRGKQYAIMTQATEILFTEDSNNTQEIIDYLKKIEENVILGAKIKNHVFLYAKENTAQSFCYSYEQSYDDYSTPQKGAFPYVRIFNKGIVCRHPHVPKMGIDVNYKEKLLPDVAPQPSLRKEGELFLSSLSFYDTKQ